MAHNFIDVIDVPELGRLDTPIQKIVTPGRSLRQNQSTPKGDRFIANRNHLDIDAANFHLTKDSSSSNNSNSSSSKNSSILGDVGANVKVLAFKDKAPLPSDGFQNNMSVLYSESRSRISGQQSAAAGNGSLGMKKQSSSRHIPQCPERILDAPDIVDDYYLNLLDWSAENILAIALGGTVYLWHASSGEITQLCDLNAPVQGNALQTSTDDYVTSVQWVKNVGLQHYLAVGTSSSAVQLWDVKALKQVREMRSHSARIGSLAWNGYLLSSGSRDSSIHNHDVRVAQHHVSSFNGHTQEVCGLQWSYDGTSLASGGNDNILNIWDFNSTAPSNSRNETALGGGVAPRHVLTDHVAAVKGLAWCPWQSNLLASGGGSADRTLKFWNATTGTCISSTDTQSQVCSVMWSKNHKELITSHGYSHNQLCVWQYPSLTKTTELFGHTARVLHLAMSPDGQTVCSASGDETLRFWKVWEMEQKQTIKSKKLEEPHSMMRGMSIR